MLRIGDILSGLLEWAPASLAWERDNIGLLVGSAETAVSRILVCLDVTPAVVDEAVYREAQCIVAHHPLIFHPLKSIRTDTPHGGMLATLLREQISVIAMHTNADAAGSGLNAELASVLGVEQPRRLDPPGGMLRQLVLHLDASDEAFEASTDVIEETFALSWSSHELDEGRAVEVIVPDFRLPALREALRERLHTALRASHVTMVDGVLAGHGIGAVGELAEALPVRTFLGMVKEQLGCERLRTTPFEENLEIRRVAVSSGAGSSYVRAAVAAGADVLVTGDLTHHTLLDYAGSILLVDAGHYETEQLFVRICAEELERQFFEDKQKIDILRTNTNTNPVWFI